MIPTNSKRGGLDFYLFSPFSPWIPTFFSLAIVLGLAFIHVFAWRVGHLTITPGLLPDSQNTEPQRLTFFMPPISLTANATPMYWFYAFGCAAFAITAVRYVHGFKNALWKYVTSLAESIPATHGVRIDEVPSPPHPETTGARKHAEVFGERNSPASPQRERVVRANRPEENTTPPNRRLAFWRHHFRRSDERLLETPAVIPPAVGSFRARYTRRTTFFQKPVLKLANLFLYIALVAFVLQAIIPARKDALSQLGSRCRRLEDIYVASGSPSGAESRRLGELPLAARYGDLPNPQTSADERRTRWLQAGLIRDYLINDPFDPKPSPVELSLSPKLIYCDTIQLQIRDFWTLVHAVSAMIFFFFSYCTMGLFCAWLIARRVSHPCCTSRCACSRRCGAESWILTPSRTSIIVKAIFTILPIFRPAEWIKKDLLRHVSLVDWAGIAQRTSVLAILLYLCTMGWEIRLIAKGLEVMERNIARVVTTNESAAEISPVMSA